MLLGWYGLGPEASVVVTACKEFTSLICLVVCRPREWTGSALGSKQRCEVSHWRTIEREVGPRRSVLTARLSASYLVDPASSHMLVSKIKPCMSKYKLLHSETANGSLDQLIFIRSYNPTWITVVILELIHGNQLRPSGKSAFIRSKPIGGSPPSILVNLNNFVLIAWPRAGDVSFKCLPYQLSKVCDMLTLVVTGNGESGFDSGEGA
jgi:hypothetical protein